MHETETRDFDYPELLDRIEALQHELARLRADAAAHLPTSDALRRSAAFDPERTGHAPESHRSRPGCRPRAVIETPLVLPSPGLAPADESVIVPGNDPVLDLAERAFSLAEQAPAPDPVAEAAGLRAQSETPMDIVRRDHVTAFRAVSADGRGGVFAGGTAPVRLLPNDAPTHPTAGRAGDLFVDAAHRLWFCRDTGDWVQLA